jgi:hypothetical protein
VLQQSNSNSRGQTGWALMSSKRCRPTTLAAQECLARNETPRSDCRYEFSVIVIKLGSWKIRSWLPTREWREAQSSAWSGLE